MSVKGKPEEKSRKIIFQFQKQPPYVFCNKNVLRNFSKFTGKHLYQSPFLVKLQAWHAILFKKILWHRCFPVNFAKFLRKAFLQNTSGRLLLQFQGNYRVFTLRHQIGCSFFYLSLCVQIRLVILHCFHIQYLLLIVTLNSIDMKNEYIMK